MALAGFEPATHGLGNRTMSGASEFLTGWNRDQIHLAVEIIACILHKVS